MNKRCSITNPAFAHDFILVKSRDIWPNAVMLDASCDILYGHHPRKQTCAYGFDIFPSDEAVMQLLSDSEVHIPCLNACIDGDSIIFTGDPDLIKHITLSPLWAKL